MRWIYPAFGAVLGVWQLGCQPKIGDGCNLSTDCSIRGDRICDLSLPGGYCTILQCLGNACPNGSACIAIDPEVPGCGYDDRRAPSRSTRTMCMWECKQHSDCRSGYRCQDIRLPPWRGRFLDDGTISNVCVVGEPTDAGVDASLVSKNDEPPVCKPGGPEIPPIDASGEASSTMMTDADTEAGADAGSEAGDAGTD